MIIIDTTDEVLLSVAKQASNYLKVKGKAFIELLFVSNYEIQQINKENRNTDMVTDVLSFPYLSEIKTFNKKNYPFDFDVNIKAVNAGSIIICEEVAKRQAEEYGHSTTRERAYLLLHGILHVFGYDHMNDADKEKMRQAEEEILVKLNILR